MIRVFTAKGHILIFDLEGWVLYQKYRWKLGNDLYLRRRAYPNKTIYFHRALLEVSGAEVDHKNGSRLDNRKDNLRLATPRQNSANRGKASRAGSTSKYKGVGYLKEPRNSKKPWRAAIGIKGKKVHLGCFVTEIEAAKAYDRAALKYFGEFARINFNAENDNLPLPCR